MALTLGKDGVRLSALIFFLSMTTGLRGQNLVRIDATAPTPPPAAVSAHLGANTNPNGSVIAVNSQYLTLNGRPWLPVMGEFHFSRYPDAEWEEEILKMKAAGVEIISTYVIWIHHEQTEGVFDWSGQRDLRKFVQLCGKHGMYVYPRIGPWAHAEVRNGGLPDWVLKNGPVRQNDPVYLREAGTLYAQIAEQLRGLLWKDGGPVIGIQIENEYGMKGPGKGSEHIQVLKQMAVADGLDVPLYTVTGWDGAAIPLDEVLPVFGGYPDAPWDSSPKQLPASEIYSFRFPNRASGSMGAIGGSGQNNSASYGGTPFLTAEVGSGIEDTYFRRPVVSADDIASIAPVMLGSGVNLLGYYMFHGGRNPDSGAGTLQESQRTGYPTDVPVKSYDFQAPLGEFGQERASLRKLKLIHYFLSDFGSILAPMATHAPEKTPASPSDISVPRVAARTDKNSGFIFFNNHVRGLPMPAYSGFQAELRLSSGAIRVPETPINLPSGAYGIWPVNLDLGGETLRYSTAQLFKRVSTATQTYYFFFTIAGVPPEFLFNSATHIQDVPRNVEVKPVPGGTRLRVRPAPDTVIHLAAGVTLVLLPESSAEQIWRSDDPNLLLTTAADAFSDGPTWTLQADDNPKFEFGIFGAGKPRPLQEELSKIDARGQSSIFTRYSVSVPAIEPVAKVNQVSPAAERAPWQMGQKFSWQPQPTALAPDDKDFEGAAGWAISLPGIKASPSISDCFLRIRYQGDAARLYQGDRLVDDDFWNGGPWEIGMREGASGSQNTPQTMELRILPLPESFPMYIERASELHFAGRVAGALTSVELIPRYQVNFEVPPSTPERR